MANNWDRVQISDVCELIVDCVNKTAPKVEYPTQYKMLRTPNVKNGRVTTHDCNYVSEETFIKWTRRAEVRKNDVLLTREAPLGEVGIVKSDEKLFLGQRLMQYRADLTKLDPDFLNYSFLSPDLQHQFRMHEGSGSVVSHIRVGDCSKFELNIPPLNVQKKIADILKTLDSKIELNRQTNQTLEQMAQALFKSWFVDFDPVIDNALAAGNDIPEALQHKAEQRKQAEQLPDFKPLPSDIRTLFPSEFEESEKGLIPKGWSIKPADEIAEIAIGKTPPRKQKEWFSEQRDGNVVWISIRDMGAESAFIGDSSEYLTPESISKFNIKVVPKDSVILSFKMTLGRVCITSCDLATNEAIAHFVNPKFGLTKEYIYSYLKAFDYDLLGSTSSIATAVNSKIIKKMPFLVPSVDIVQNFNDSLGRIFSKKLLILEQSRELEKLRDTLLPKLISGELSVENNC